MAKDLLNLKKGFLWCLSIKLALTLDCVTAPESGGGCGATAEARLSEHQLRSREGGHGKAVPVPQLGPALLERSAIITTGRPHRAKRMPSASLPPPHCFVLV